MDGNNFFRWKITEVAMIKTSNRKNSSQTSSLTIRRKTTTSKAYFTIIEILFSDTMESNINWLDLPDQNGNLLLSPVPIAKTCFQSNSKDI